MLRQRLRSSFNPVRTAVRYSQPPACSPCARGSPPEFPKHFDGEFFGARRVADDAGNDAGDARVVGVEDGFEIERALGKLPSCQ